MDNRCSSSAFSGNLALQLVAQRVRVVFLGHVRAGVPQFGGRSRQAVQTFGFHAARVPEAPRRPALDACFPAGQGDGQTVAVGPVALLALAQRREKVRVRSFLPRRFEPGLQDRLSLIAKINDPDDLLVSHLVGVLAGRVLEKAVGLFQIARAQVDDLYRPHGRDQLYADHGLSRLRDVGQGRFDIFQGDGLLLAGRLAGEDAGVEPDDGPDREHGLLADDPLSLGPAPHGLEPGVILLDSGLAALAVSEQLLADGPGLLRTEALGRQVAEETDHRLADLVGVAEELGWLAALAEGLLRVGQVGGSQVAARRALLRHQGRGLQSPARQPVADGLLVVLDDRGGWFLL